MDQAMQWVQRLSEDNASDKDLLAWLSWYEGDERHRQAFDEMQSFWNQLGDAGRSAGFHARLAVMERDEDRPRYSAHLFSGAIAATVLLVGMAAVIAWHPWTARIRETAANNTQPPEEPRVRHTQLPDGSSVDLAARTSLTVQYTPDQRTLKLENGEAFFSVAPNHERPFVVKTSALQVRAVGTKFDVREESDRVLVTVVQGIVDVSPMDQDSKGAGRPIRLNAGNEVTWLKNSGERIVRATAPERALAWRDGRLDYVNETLATVVSDINRYSNTRIVIHDPSVEKMTYTGTVLLQSIDEWLHAMPSEFPIKVVHESSQVALVSSSAAPTHD
jgi:transmembrane sensor